MRVGWQKSKMAFFVSKAHCKTESFHSEYVTELKKYVEVEAYGDCIPGGVDEWVRGNG